MKKISPFAVETVKLYVPLKGKEMTVTELNFRPPTTKDAMATDGCQDKTVAAALALMESMTGVSKYLLEQLVPEDFANCSVILARTNLRYTGQINLFEGTETDNPLEAANDVQPESSPQDSAES
ncbi:MAG: phage tail assembly protein [Treponema sp.]|nr:phage tail assembly protein [Treponema sp.]